MITAFLREILKKLYLLLYAWKQGLIVIRLSAAKIAQVTSPDTEITVSGILSSSADG